MFNARKLFVGLVFSSFLAVGLASPAQAAEQGALQTFKTHHEAVQTLKKDGDKSKDKLQSEVDDLLDYETLAQTALGGGDKWKERCGERCDEFQTLLTDLIRKNYLKRIGSDAKYEMTIVGEEARSTSTRVTTQITTDRDGKPEVVEVVYKMKQQESGWKVVDIITDGVSLAKNWRYECTKVVKESGIDELILRLKKKVKKLDE